MNLYMQHKCKKISWTNGKLLKLKKLDIFLRPGGTKWHQMEPNGTRWNQVESGETKWSQVKLVGPHLPNGSEHSSPRGHSHVRFLQHNNCRTQINNTFCFFSLKSLELHFIRTCECNGGPLYIPQVLSVPARSSRT